MFEHFTQQAREALVAAIAHARVNGDVVRPEHLLEAVCADAETATLMGRIGFGPDDLTATLEGVAVSRRRGGLTDVDARALREFGIDLDSVVEQVERQLGPGALGSGRGTRIGGRFRRDRFSHEAKRCLEEGVRQAKTRRDGSFGCLHLLLGILVADAVVADAMAVRGVTIASVLAEVDEDRAAG